MLDVAYRVTSEDLARIPATVIRRVRRDFKIVANSLLASVPELQPKDGAVVGPMAWGSVIGQLACGAANLGCKPVFSRLGRAGKRVRRQNCLPHRPVRRQTDPLPRAFDRLSQEAADARGRRDTGRTGDRGERPIV
jgi:hypothetical protein